MGYNTIKDKWNVHELHNMLIQEEARLKKQRDHSINLMGQQRAGKKPAKNNGKGKQGLHKVNVSSTQVHKKEHKNDKCHFYKKPRHYKKDCLKRNAWLKKKGKPSAFVCFESNLAEVPYNTWWSTLVVPLIFLIRCRDSLRSKP